MPSSCAPLVCDVGSGSIKIGYANGRTPKKIIPSIIGPPKHIGNDAIKNGNEIQCSFPIEGGVVRNWDDMEVLFSHAIDEVKENDTNSGSRILVTEPPLNPPYRTRNGWQKCFLKTWILKVLNPFLQHYWTISKLLTGSTCLPLFFSINISNQAILVLYAQGLLSGIVIDCGEGVSQVVPVFEGFVPNHLVKRHAITGQHITKYLSSLLQLRSNSKFISDMVTVQDIKEKLCYAAQDLEQDRRLARETTVLVEEYSLPDGTSVKVGREKFECTEAFFQPSLLDMESPGLSDFVFDTIQECDVSTRKVLYEHIVLS